MTNTRKYIDETDEDRAERKAPRKPRKLRPVIDYTERNRRLARDLERSAARQIREAERQTVYNIPPKGDL